MKPWHSTLTPDVKLWHSTLIVTTRVKPWHSTHVVLTGGFGHQYRQLLQSFNFDVEGSDVFVQAIMTRQQCLQRSKQSTDDGRQRAQTSITLPPTPLRSIPKLRCLSSSGCSVIARALSLRSPLPPPSQPHLNSQHTEKRDCGFYSINKVTDELPKQNRNAEDQALSPCDSGQAKPSQADPADSRVLIRSLMSYLGRTAMLKTSRSHPVIQGLISQPS